MNFHTQGYFATSFSFYAEVNYEKKNGRYYASGSMWTGREKLFISKNVGSRMKSLLLLI